MANIGKLNTGNVIINTGTVTSAKLLPKKEKDAPQQVSITIVPNKTTAKELQSQLSQLGIKYTDTKELENIAGKNKVFDSKEKLEMLDDYLEKKVAIYYDIAKAGIKIDEEFLKSLPPENAADKDYIKALKELANAGIKIDEEFLKSLSPENAADKDYIKALKELANAGIKIDKKVVAALTPEQIKSPNALALYIMSEKLAKASPKDALDIAQKINKYKPIDEVIMKRFNDPKALAIQIIAIKMAKVSTKEALEIARNIEVPKDTTHKDIDTPKK